MRWWPTTGSAARSGLRPNDQRRLLHGPLSAKGEDAVGRLLQASAQTRGVLAADQREDERGEHQDHGKHNDAAGNGQADRHRDSPLAARARDYLRAVRAPDVTRSWRHYKSERDRDSGEHTEKTIVAAGKPVLPGTTV